MGKRKLFGSGGVINPFGLAERKKQKRKKNPVSKFYPDDYSTGELRSISKGRTPEAYVHSMNRSDVPKTVKQKALAELKRRNK